MTDSRSACTTYEGSPYIKPKRSLGNTLTAESKYGIYRMVLSISIASLWKCGMKCLEDDIVHRAFGSCCF